MKEYKTQSSHNKTVISRIRSLNLLIGLTMLALLSSCISSPATSTPKPTPTPKPTSTPDTIYYVDGDLGSDSNPGSQAQPWRTIQKCLNAVTTGNTCLVAAGTYNESLVLKKSGTKTSPIRLIANGIVTVNSGNSRTLVTTGEMGYYTIDGFRFISKFPNSNNEPMAASVNFSLDYWGDGHTEERGNDGFILRNCYIEGAMYFHGSDNLVENCELNGGGVISNGLTERSQPSENNIFRNNVIHDYTNRGGWSLQFVHNSLWEGNTIYNIGSGGLSQGIDSDGAGHANYGLTIRNNHFYNIKGEGAIMLENTFDSLVEGNVIYDSKSGIYVINYNIENGDGFKSDKNYKDLVTNTVIRNNVIYNIAKDAFLCKAVRGNQFVNNTIHNVTNTSYWGAVGLASYNNKYCYDWTIKNNIVSQSNKTVWYEGNPPNVINDNFYSVFNANINNVGVQTFAQWQAMGFDTRSRMGNPLFVNATAGDFHLQANSPACTSGVNGGYVGAFPCY